MIGTNLATTPWRTSSWSGPTGECVEVAASTDVILVRDSKNRTGPILTFPRGTWRRFISDVCCDEVGRQ
jgi:hypothetical protein